MVKKLIELLNTDFLINKIGLLFFVILFMSSCSKDNVEIFDIRDNITGKYYGIRVNTSWGNTVVGWYRDTSQVEIILSKTEKDSIINMDIYPNYVSGKFSFIYNGNDLFSTSTYHLPTLEIVDDSLYFKHQGGLGPIWTELFANKED